VPTACWRMAGLFYALGAYLTKAECVCFSRRVAFPGERPQNAAAQTPRRDRPSIAPPTADQLPDGDRHC
jgi:hypothetical protein